MALPAGRLDEIIALDQCLDHLLVAAVRIRIVECASPDPDWARSEFAWSTVLAADTVEPVLDRDDVVAYLGRIIDFTGGRLAGLEAQQLSDVGLGALDPRAEHCLESGVRSGQQVRVEDWPPDAAEPVREVGRTPRSR